MDIKLAYIGGGSKQWARVFMNDLALAENLGGEIGLYDIDLQAAIRNQQIGERINDSPQAKSRWNYVVYDNLDEALLGADFVIMSILPGTFEEMRSDVHTPEKYGILQPVGDTAGCGGVLRAMRTVPLYQEFALAIKDNCPNAWVINFTNPMSICVRALYDTFPKIKAFGCCHEVFHTQDLLTRVLKQIEGIEVNRHSLVCDVSGVNHFTWMTSAKYEDIDIINLLPEFIDMHYHSGYNPKGNADAYQKDPFACSNRVKMDLFRRYGVLPTGGDRHITEFLNNKWYLDSKESIDRWKFALTSVDFRIRQMEERVAESKAMAEGTKTVEVKKSDEEAVELIKAILGLNDVVSNVNLPNIGQIESLPLKTVVETNAMFTQNCVTPIKAKPLPDAVQNLVTRAALNIETCYEGIKTRDLDAIFNSFINQAQCGTLTLTEGRDLFEEMIYNTREYLSPYYDIEQIVNKF